MKNIKKLKMYAFLEKFVEGDKWFSSPNCDTANVPYGREALILDSALSTTHRHHCHRV